MRLLAPEYPSVVETARRCTAHLGLAQLPATAQPSLLHLWVDADEVPLYLQGLRAGVARLRSPAEQGALLKDEVLRLLDMVPARGALADTLIGELDRLGVAAGEAAATAHIRRANLARDLENFTSAVEEVQRGLHTESAFMRFDSSWVQYPPGLRGLYASGVLWAQHLVPRDSLLQREGPQVLLGSWRREAGVEAKLWRLNARDSAEMVQTVLRGGGRIPPPLQADYWFNRSDTTTHTRKQNVSLVVFVDERCGAACYVEYSALTRLKRRFGSRLEVVLVTNTKGFFRQHPPLEPAAEAEALRHYFLADLALPATLAVVNAPFTTLPAPDRRRLYNRSPLFAAYDVMVNDQPHRPAFLIGGDGLVLGQRDLSSDEVEVEHLIADLLVYESQHS